MTDELAPKALEEREAAPALARTGVRRWVATGVAVSMATGVFGFLAGRAVAPDDDTAVSVASDPEVSDPSATVPAAPVTVTPTVPADGRENADTTAFGNEVAGSTGTGTYEGDQLGAYPDPAMTPLLERTTDGGIFVRVLRMDQPALDGDFAYPGGGWMPADWCYPNGSVRIELVTATAAQVTWGSLYAADAELPKAQSFAGGYAQNAPFYGINVQVDPAVTTARFVANGATDEAPVVDGVAVLAVPGPIDPAFELTLVDATGTPRVFGEDDLTMTVASDRYLDECTPPPPALPDAGDQPAEPAVTRAAVEASFEAAYARDGTGLAFIDDPTGVQDARDRVDESSYAETAATAELAIDQLVFTSPTEAWFRYSIRTDVSSFTNRFGIARLSDDGVWRITRATVCQDLALIPDGGCEPAAEPVQPPSVAGWYGSQGD